MAGTDGLSDFLADAILGILADTTPTTYENIFWQLHTGSPGAAGTENIAAGTTTRESSTVAAPASGAATLSNTPSFTNTGDVTETLTDVSAWSAATAGTFLFSIQCVEGLAWTNAQTVQLSVDLAMGPLASG
jgi:hypothetical protein